MTNRKPEFIIDEIQREAWESRPDEIKNKVQTYCMKEGRI